MPIIKEILSRVGASRYRPVDPRSRSNGAIYCFLFAVSRESYFILLVYAAPAFTSVSRRSRRWLVSIPPTKARSIWMGGGDRRGIQCRMHACRDSSFCLTSSIIRRNFSFGAGEIRFPGRMMLHRTSRRVVRGVVRLPDLSVSELFSSAILVEFQIF